MFLMRPETGASRKILCPVVPEYRSHSEAYGATAIKEALVSGSGFCFVVILSNSSHALTLNYSAYGYQTPDRSALAKNKQASLEQMYKLHQLRSVAPTLHDHMHHCSRASPLFSNSCRQVMSVLLLSSFQGAHHARLSSVKGSSATSASAGEVDSSSISQAISEVST